MSENLVTTLDNTSVLTEAWGEASKSRGKANMQLAIDFVTEFPIGKKLDAATFDDWAQSRGLLKVPPADASKDSDAWKAHLMRRHELRYRINRSGTHPRLRENGSTPFSFDTIQTGLYEVRAPHSAVAQSGIPTKIASYIDTKRKRLAYLMQSEDWNILPPYERVVAETIFDDIDGFRDVIHQQSDRIANKIAKLEGRLRRAIEMGQIKPQTDGIKQLLSPDTDLPEEGSGGPVSEAP